MQRLAHRILLLAGGALLCLLVGLIHPAKPAIHAGSQGRGRAARVDVAASGQPSNPLLRGAHVIGSWLWHLARHHPHGTIAVLVALVLLVGVPRLIALLPRQIDKDPVRMFTSEQRHSAFARAGGRCEMESLFFIRCRRPAAHGDHWFPHSKGGRTNMRNLVAACAPCNTGKGARTPTAWETTRLEWRRRRYFPEGVERRPSAA